MRTVLSLLVLSASLAAAGRPTLTGKVTDASGKPLDHATVLVYHAGVKKGYSTFCPSCYTDCEKRAITDAAGAFTIDSLDPDLWFELLAIHDGYSPRFIKRVDAAAGTEVRAVLTPRPKIDDPARVALGRVVNEHGTPLRDVVVQPQGILFNSDKGRMSVYGTIDGLEPIAVTNATGEFELAYAKPALKMLLLVEARGMAPKLFNNISTGPERQTMTVTDGALVHGRLVQNGKPVAGAEIGLVARQRGWAAELRLVGSPYDEVRIGTQADGSFAIPNVPAPAEWYVYGKMESIAPRGATGAVPVVTKSDEEDIDLGDIAIRPGYSVRGKIELSDGKSIPGGMRAFIAPDGDFDSQTVMLNADGRFEFIGLAPGKYSINGSVRGYSLPEEHKYGFAITVDKDLDNVVVTLDPAAGH